MQSTHSTKPIMQLRFIDDLADRLLTYCPLSALTLLTLLVAGLANAGPRPWLFLGAMIVADIGINVVRTARSRRPRQQSWRTQTTAVRSPYAGHRPMAGR
jgi:phosphatidylglycerophosphate synthase